MSLLHYSKGCFWLKRWRPNNFHEDTFVYASLLTMVIRFCGFAAALCLTRITEWSKLRQGGAG